MMILSEKDASEIRVSGMSMEYAWQKTGVLTSVPRTCTLTIAVLMSEELIRMRTSGIFMCCVFCLVHHN